MTVLTRRLMPMAVNSAVNSFMTSSYGDFALISLCSARAEQAHDPGAELHQRRDLRARQLDHLVVPAAGALHEIEHLLQTARRDRTHFGIIARGLDAFAQRRRGRIELARLAP